MNENFRKGFEKTAGLIDALGTGLRAVGTGYRRAAGVPNYLKRSLQGRTVGDLEQHYALAQSEKALRNAAARKGLEGQTLENYRKAGYTVNEPKEVKEKVKGLGKTLKEMPVEDKLMYGIPGTYLAGKTIDAMGSK